MGDDDDQADTALLSAVESEIMTIEAPPDELGCPVSAVFRNDDGEILFGRCLAGHQRLGLEGRDELPETPGCAGAVEAAFCTI